MASDLSNLLARRSAIYAELASIGGNGTGPTPAGLVNSNIDGQSFDFAKYKQGLFDELKTINEQIALADGGTYEIVTQGIPVKSGSMSYAPTPPIAQAYQWVPNTEAVTVVLNSPPRSPRISGVSGIRRALKFSELQALQGLGIQPSDVVFNLWADKLGSYAIAGGDRIIDATNVHYVVISAQLVTLATRWRIVARKEVR